MFSHLAKLPVGRQVYAEGTQDSSYTEVNVEDPSPGFQSLRDSVDMQLCMDHNFFQFGAGGGAQIRVFELECEHTRLTDSRSRFLFPSRQAQKEQDRGNAGLV